MPDSPSGVYTLPPSYKVANGDLTDASQHNPPFEDVQQALTNRLHRDGRTAWTGNQNANGNKITNLADGTSAQDAATVGQAVPGVGDELNTYRDPGSKWLRRDGAIYTSASYPALAPLMEPIAGQAIFTTITTGVSFAITGFAYGSGRWIGSGAGTSGVRTVVSIDKETWNGVDPLFSYYMNTLIYADGKFVSALFDGNVGTSSTGAAGSWTLHSAGGAAGLSTEIAFGNGVWILVGSGSSSGSTVVRKSSDLSSWSTITPAGLAGNRRCIAFGNDVFVMGGAGNQVHISDDGDSWSTSTITGITNVDRLTFKNGYFWASGSSGNLYRSEDGVSWSSITTGATSRINDIAFGAGSYLAICQNGDVFASSDADGASWAKQASPYAIALNKVLFDDDDDTFLIAGADGLIASVYFETSPLFRVPNDNPTNGWIRALP